MNRESLPAKGREYSSTFFLKLRDSVVKFANPYTYQTV
jgi:hypothetical protein